MRNKLLLLAAIVGMTFAACEKETIHVPVEGDARWTLTIAGNPLDSFHIVLYTSVIPYREVDYLDVLGGGNSPMKIEMEVGQTYAIKYMDTDSTMKLIMHTPTDLTNVYNTIPATVW